MNGLGAQSGNLFLESLDAGVKFFSFASSIGAFAGLPGVERLGAFGAVSIDRHAFKSQFPGIDIGVANGRGDRLCNLSDIDNADGHGGFGFRRMAGFSAPSLRRAIATEQSILLLVMQ